VRKTQINWENGTATELRQLHRCEDDRVTARRLFGMIKLSEGRSVREVSQIMEISECSIQRWIKVFNESGIEGLVRRGAPGRKKSITVDVFNSLIVPVL
jgi:transposase